MANVIYDKGREAFLNGQLDWTNNDIKCVLVDTATYVVDLVNDQFLSDIPVGERVSTSANLTGKTTTAGVADADNTAFNLVTGDISEAVVIYQDTGAEGTSRLIAYLDVAVGLPLSPNGGNIILEWSDDSDKIFKL